MSADPRNGASRRNENMSETAPPRSAESAPDASSVSRARRTKNRHAKPGLDANFYAELLHIAGLRESTAAGKTVVARRDDAQRQPGALIELAVAAMAAIEAREASGTPEQAVLRTALRLCIAWLGRLVFLKLLEARLLALHDGESAYAFLRSARVGTFAQLDALCRDVFGDGAGHTHLPRFDGAMFESADLATLAIGFSTLPDDAPLAPFEATVLTPSPAAPARNTVTYLLDFLDAFEFGFDTGTPTNASAPRRQRIDAATLGLVFEKLNGYRDGAWYTPGRVAMMLARAAVTGAALGRFNQIEGWRCTTLDQLSERIEHDTRHEAARTMLASLRVCDPAVGTGHLLVSALDELIALKARLRLFDDIPGHALAGLRVDVADDRLSVTLAHGVAPNREQQRRIDAALYREKHAIVEQNLFGVDIDADALGMARRRLAFELLAHAAYDDAGRFATLPDLAANLRQGNAVLSRVIDSDDALSPAQDFDWRAEFPALRDAHGAFAGFDAVLANPPYVDSERMINEGQRALREQLARRWPSARGNWDLFIVFMELGLALTAPHGTMAFLTPDKWLAKPFGAAFRARHLDAIERVVALGRGVFEHALVDAIVTVFRPAGCASIETARLDQDVLTSLARAPKRELDASWTLDALLSLHYAFVRRLAHAHGTLGELIACENACATSDAYALAPCIEEARGAFDARRHYRVVNTGTLGRYVSRWGVKPMTYLGQRYAEPVVERERFEAAFANRYRAKAAAKKVIVKGLTHLDATLDLAGDTIPGKTTLILRADDDALLKFAAAVLNCPLAAFVTRARFGASSYNGGVAFTKAMIDAIPVPRDESARADVVRRVDRLLASLGSVDDAPRSDALAREIDSALYAAYGLEKNEIALIDGDRRGTRQRA